MPGAYAHLTLATVLNGDPLRLEAAGLPREAISALMKHSEFVCLGAVSPDYPYLVMADASAGKWADAMHYDHTGEFLKRAVRRLSGEETGARARRLAWLLGFASHVGGDITIHPVVERRVGPYQGNEKAHQKCEMHQDVFIFPRLNLGAPDVPEYLDATLKTCGDEEGLAADIRDFWTALLVEIHPALAAEIPPDPRQWHSWFVRFVDMAEELSGLPAFARHVAAHLNPVYPTPGELDKSYLENLETPTGRENYERIFLRAEDTVLWLWRLISGGVCNGENTYLTEIRNWNLDNGHDEDGNITAWERA